MEFLESVVVRRRISRHPKVFRAASPIARRHFDAPPFLIVHGTADGSIPVQQARAFVEELRAVSKQPVANLELGGAHGERTASAATAIGLFLNQMRRARSVDNEVGYAGQGVGR